MYFLPLPWLLILTSISALFYVASSHGLVAVFIHHYLGPRNIRTMQLNCTGTNIVEFMDVAFKDVSVQMRLCRMSGNRKVRLDSLDEFIEAQREKAARARSDVEKLELLKQKALANPQAFIENLQREVCIILYLYANYVLTLRQT